MGRSRWPSPCTRMIRHSPRRHACGRGGGYMYAFISLLLFCMLAVFHSKLGAIPSSNASPVARFFTSPISQSESNSDKILSSLQFASLGNVSLDSDVAEPKLENSTASTGSLSVAEDEDEDEDEEEDEDPETQEEDSIEEGEEDEEDEEDNGEDEAGLEHDRRKLKDVSKLHDAGTLSADKMVVSGMLLSNKNYGKVKTVLANDGEHGQAKTQPQKSLLKLGAIKTLARWDPLEDMGGRRKEDYAQRGSNSWQHSIQQPFDRSGGSRWHGVAWDHLLGVIRKTDPIKSSTARKIKPGAQHSIHVAPEVNQSHSSSSHITQNFGSDDEPSDLTVIDKLEDFASIEDALLLKGKNAFLRVWPEKKPTKGDAFRKDRPNKANVDPLNPINNPLLQDPDTFGSSGLSGSDKVMLKALRRSFGKAAVEKQEMTHADADNFSTEKSLETTLDTNSNGNSGQHRASNDGRQLGNAAERSILDLSHSHSSLASDGEEKQEFVGRVSKIKLISSSDSSKEKHVSRHLQKSSLDTRQWGSYPTLHPKLGFSEFMDQFLGDESCSHNIFMVWTTPPWTYTVRYQRGLESLLYFHPKACVVVFSESIELDFFKSFVNVGFRVAVVAPNLEELLDGTPAAMFSYFWLTWRKTPHYYIHYSELLRLAALYKYGGIYLDTDVILLKPLSALHNTIGAETVENQTQKLNGAVMAFEKSSVYLLECLVEFTETYDDQLLDFNGAGLVTRVAERIRGEEKSSEQATGTLHVELPHVFFPLSSADIKRYFKAPESEQEQMETDGLFESIYNQSRTLHFWNAQTRTLVPESSSLVERIINHHCIKCHDYL